MMNQDIIIDIVASVFKGAITWGFFAIVLSFIVKGR